MKRRRRRRFMGQRMRCPVTSTCCGRRADARERLDALAPVDRAVGVIAFDTKAEVGWLSGSAAR
ncbi:hypothetical protein [Saccharothrix sp. NRRL B-16314]|uniref:hypothetical protein n=1 Tax=Saccharothrix sp. NRRL B-16314 TaxID=1463825 RepID=UPI0012DE6CE7|nr:hypothetical protein [Saccharothrix sp. NRRL B-16314]